MTGEAPAESLEGPLTGGGAGACVRSANKWDFEAEAGRGPRGVRRDLTAVRPLLINTPCAPGGRDGRRAEGRGPRTNYKLLGSRRRPSGPTPPPSPAPAATPRALGPPLPHTAPPPPPLRPRALPCDSVAALRGLAVY